MFNTKQIVNIALLSAIGAVLSMIKVFSMPNGGSITLYLVPLIIASFNYDFKTNLFIGLVSATLQLLIGGFLIHPIQILLDYYIPIILICSAQVLKFNKYFNTIIASFFAMMSYVISGMIFFKVPFILSIIYNATFFVPTVIISILIVYFINPKLEKSIRF